MEQYRLGLPHYANGFFDKMKPVMKIYGLTSKTEQITQPNLSRGLNKKIDSCFWVWN